MSRRRDRRGRGRRGPLAWPPVPAMITRSAAFDELVLDTAARFRPALGRRWEELELAVEEVPAEPLPWETSPPLARLYPPAEGLPARVVVYRRAVHTLARTPEATAALVHEVLREQLAALLGVDPADLEPGG